ncbi:MAG: hypothetical protein BME94_08425 [Methanobacteriales archaeon Met13]
MRKYLCKSCGKKFTTSLNSIIKPGYRYPSIFRAKIIDLFQTGYRSLRNASEDLLNIFGVKKYHIKPYITGYKKQLKTSYSGYYCYDEQYVKINGTWMYRLTLYDHILNIPVSEKISPDKGYTTIKQFMDELDVKHQLCISHNYSL